jgi:hypothetical protein
MTILYAGGEDTGFTAIGTVSAGTPSTQTCRSGYTKGCIQVGGTAVADPPPNRYQTPTFTAVSALWFHAQLGLNSNFGAFTPPTGLQTIIMRSPDGVARLLFRQTGTGGNWKLSTRNAAGTITDLITGTSYAGYVNAISQVDVFVNYTVSGSVALYFANNSVPNISFSGDPRTDSATQINQIELGAIAPSANPTVLTSWSECIVADEDTRSMAVWTLDPQAAGNAQSWTPNTLANVQKPAISDATFVSTAANNALSEWTTPTTPPSGTWGVKAIVQNARVQVPTTGPQHFDWLARTAATDYLAGAPQAPIAGFANFQHIWPLNPATGLPWQITDIAAGFNLGIESQA